MDPLTRRLTPATDPRLTRLGTVVSVDSDAWTLTVMLDESSNIVVPALRHLPLTTIQPGESVLLLRDRHQLWAIGAIGKAPAEAPPPPPPVENRPPQPPTPPVTTTLAPYVTGSARGGTWRGDTDTVYQGDWTGRGVNVGAAFYRKPGVSGATVTACRVQIKRGGGGVYAPVAPTIHLWQQGAPSGSLTSQGSIAGPALSIGQAATVTLPYAWGVNLLSGASGGLGVYVPGSSPYVALDGRSRYGPSFAVTITYQTEET